MWSREWLSLHVRTHTTRPYENEGRQDVVVDKSPGLDYGPSSVRALRPSEREATRWNLDPFVLDGGSGHAEYDPGTWLLAYWSGRYWGFVGSAD